MFHAFAHACESEKGHQLYYHTACQKAVEYLKIPHHAYIPKDHSLPQLPENWVLHFPKPYDKRSKKDYFKACNSLFQKRGAFFIETLMRRDMRYFSLAALRHGKKSDRLCMLFRDNNIFKKKRDEIEVKFFLTLLRAKFRRNLCLFTDTDNLTYFFREKTGLPFHTLPIPNFDLKPVEHHNEKLVIVFPGEPRAEKGGHVVRRLLNESHGCHFICSQSLEQAQEHFPNALSREKYLEYIQRADVVLLPYDAPKYRYRSSGIFVEAIGLGKVTLVPDECWMSDELRKHNLVEFITDFERPDFFRHLKNLCENSRIREKLKKMQQHYLEYHTPKTYARILDEVASLNALCEHTTTC